MTGAEAALGAARLGDEVVHGFGLLGMVGGAILGAVVAFAFFAGTVATGGLLAVAVVGGCIAAGGLAGGSIARGIMKAADLPGPTTGVLAAAGPSRVSVNSRQALRAGVDFTASCSGAPMNHPPIPLSLVIAEGSKTVRINGKPMARQSMRMRCGAKVKAGSDNVTVGGPTDTVVLVIDTEAIFESGLKVVGVLSLFAGAAGLSIAGASVAAKLSFLGITVGQMTVGEAALQALHKWGESLGPGYGDIMVGAAGFALLPLQNTKPPKGTTPQTGSSPSRAEIRARVEGNIAQSRAAREASNFSEHVARTRSPAEKGAHAENAVSNHLGIPRNTGSGRATVPGTGRGGYRVPDFSPDRTINTRGTVVEIKNVQSLSITPQLRDLSSYAQSRNVPLEIFTNAPPPTRGELARLIEQNRVILTPIP